MSPSGCGAAGGNLNDSKFSDPLPWIGSYVAAASFACAVAMAADAALALRRRLLWFPAKFLSLNAASLTLIGVAIKLSLDLNTDMPSRQDQLAKLSSAAFVCTLIGNSMPSLGSTENTEMCMNVVALGILVLTLVVNLSIQLATGAIYAFRVEHILIVFLMLVLLVILASVALVLPTIKHHLEFKYAKKRQFAVRECNGPQGCKPVVEKLKQDLMGYWLMAHTSSPQFVLARSVMSTAAGLICLLTAGTLAEAMFRSYLTPLSLEFCGGNSDYKRSTTVVLVVQTVGVGVGTIAPACRWFIAILLRCPKKGVTFKQSFRVEAYWTQSLVELKECPPVSRISNRRVRKLSYSIKCWALASCIKLQIGIVLFGKMVKFLSVVFVGRLLLCCSNARQIFKSETCVSFDGLGCRPHPDLSLSVLLLEGEEELREVMVNPHCNATEHWFQKGRKMQPKHLLHLLEKWPAPSLGLCGVTASFDSDQVPSLDVEEPSNCWGLSIVTLTAIVVMLPGIHGRLTEQLLYGVNEGLSLVSLIENQLDAEGDLVMLRKAADIVWIGVDLCRKWLDVDLQKLALQAKAPVEALQELSDIAKNKVIEFHKKYPHGCWKETPNKWPPKVLAANSLYRISQTILLSQNNHTSEMLFEGLSSMISNTLCACLSNLGHVIPMECFSGNIEEREERVQQAVFVLGKTEKILKIVDHQALPSPYRRRMSSRTDKLNPIGKQESFPLNAPSEYGGSSLSSSSLDICIE